MEKKKKYLYAEKNPLKSANDLKCDEDQAENHTDFDGYFHYQLFDLRTSTKYLKKTTYKRFL